MSRQRYIAVGGKWVPANEAALVAEQKTAMIMPDIQPFRSSDGAYISGRAAWREHLKATGTIEMGHADVAAQRNAWNKKREAFQNRLKLSVNAVREASPPVGEIRPIQRTGLNVEIANRLHNRPAPDRKELIKLTLDLAKRNNRGR